MPRCEYCMHYIYSVFDVDYLCLNEKSPNYGRAMHFKDCCNNFYSPSMEKEETNDAEGEENDL